MSAVARSFVCFQSSKRNEVRVAIDPMILIMIASADDGCLTSGKITGRSSFFSVFAPLATAAAAVVIFCFFSAAVFLVWMSTRQPHQIQAKNDEQKNTTLHVPCMYIVVVEVLTIHLGIYLLVQSLCR